MPAQAPLLWRLRGGLRGIHMVAAVGLILLGLAAVAWGAATGAWSGAGLGVALAVGGCVVLVLRGRAS